MRVHRFFLKIKIFGDTIKLIESDVIHQMRDVFRLKKNDTVIILDNSGFEFEAIIDHLTRDEILLHVSKKIRNDYKPKTDLHLMYALTKKDTFEWVLEKCTELGVSEFTPVIAERTEKKNFNFDRGEKIIKEAAEQSGKNLLPILNSIVNIKELCENNEKEKINTIAFHLDGEQFKANSFLSHEKLSVLIGPEGGWSDAELALFKEKNISIYTLGKQVLRAETAAIAVTSLLMF